MKVGVFVEGTYPYVTGGVSTWLHVLMSNLKEIEFHIYHLKPDSQQRALKYKLPDNVTLMKEINIFSEIEWKLRRKAPENIVTDIFYLVTMESDIVKVARGLKRILMNVTGKDVYSLLSSKAFWDVITEVYRRFFKTHGFTEFYWMMRNLLTPFINSFQFLPEKDDIYHSITTGYASLAAIAGKFHYGVPLIITEHGIYHREREKEILSSKYIPEEYKKMWIGFFKTISALAYYSTDFLTTLFKKNQIFQKELKADESKMSIIPNGVDVEKFNLPKEKHEGFVVGFIGRISKIKDVKTAIKAIRVAKEEIKDLKFLIIGPKDEEEEYYDECQMLVQIMELEDTVEFLGPQNVLEYYPKIDVLLLSSVSEGQPLVILEAMASGTPVVATDVGACREMLEDELGQSGFIVPPKDYIEMAKALIKLHDDKELWKEFSNNGKRVVREKYRLDQMIERYKNLYMKAVQLKGKIKEAI
ncbi:MAG: GT4 family glycosyltransferase PelF [Thermotogaceae bacterium]|nr:GT4 family glycosyltransferase PelF [Thermotogaceae bacterium]